MIPVKFKEQNKVLGKPQGMTEEECGSLPVFNDGKVSISCWRAGFKERVKFLFTGKAWLGVYGGFSQPPVWVEINFPFSSKKQVQ